MMRKAIHISLFLGLFAGSWICVQAQEQPLKDFAEDRRDSKMCFYPSTLRMVNLANDPLLDELATGIEKLLVYQLDSATSLGIEYKQVFDEYLNLGFEEYASAYGGGFDFYLCGLQKGRGHGEYVGMIKQEEGITMFYLRGGLAVMKIPQLIQSMQTGDILNPLNFNLEDFGESTQNQ